MMPKISILTCAYNRPEMLREALESVREQTISDWEHLVTDAGSSDISVPACLARAAASDPRLSWRRRIYANQPARYWNEMIDLARGRYVCFLDDDNLQYPTYLETMSKVLDAREDIDVVTCGMTLDDGGEFHLNLRTDELIGERNTIDNGCFMIRREAFDRIGYYPLCIRTLEDWALMRRAAAHLRMEHLSESLARYRTHASARSKQSEELGITRDAAWIRAATWSPIVRARVIPSSPFAEVFAKAMSEVPWIEEGSDFVIQGDGRRLRVRTNSGDWVVVSDARDFDAISDSGWLERKPGWFESARHRVVACPLDAITPERAARVVNSIRSVRYEAVIP